MKNPRALLSLVIAAVLSCLVPMVSAPGEASAQQVGASVPDFALKDLNGKPVRLSALRGKVVVISFWATWCAPCLQELPHMQKLSERYGDALVVLAINTDGPETVARVRSLVHRNRWSIPVLLDSDGTVASTHNPRGVNPFTLILDAKGRVALAHEGYAPGDEQELEATVARLIGR